MKYIDLSHTFIDNMPVFPGDPPVSLKQITNVQENGYTDHQLSTVMHVGTHMDAPLHMIEGGKYIDELPVSHFAGSGIYLDAVHRPVIDADMLESVAVSAGAILLIHSGMSDLYGKPEYDTAYPRITEAFASAVVAKGISVVGLDFINPDHEETFPIHKILLSKDVLIIENLTNLNALAGIAHFDVFAFPMKLHAEAAPVRVVARFG